MKLLEVPAAIRRATKYDLFEGDLDNLRGQQFIKQNTTVFYRNFENNGIEGPDIIEEHRSFSKLYHMMLIGKVGVITPIPEKIKNEYLFNLILREAQVEDLLFLSHALKHNRMYYTYKKDKVLLGPFYISNTTKIVELEDMISHGEVFIPNEKQHFEFIEYKKIA